jgi:hypothetical protein
MHGQADCLKLLIERGANVSASTREGGIVVDYLFHIKKTPFKDVCACIDLLIATQHFKGEEARIAKSIERKRIELNNGSEISPNPI